MKNKPLALQMKELSKNHNYNRILKQIKEAAQKGKRSLPVFKTNINLKETQKLLDEGFTVENKSFLGYEAFEITW